MSQPALPQVLVCGEAVVDFIAQDDGLYRRCAGGSPLNAAIATARLQVLTGFVGVLSADANGTFLEDWLQASGVDLGWCQRSSARQALVAAVPRVGQAGAGDIDYALYFDGTSEDAFDATLLPECPAHLRLFHLGSVAAIRQPHAACFTQLRSGLPVGVIRTYDPNIRPAIMGQRGDVRPLVEAHMAASDLVKLSREDAAWLYPGWSPARVLAHIAALGVDLAILTNGAAGLQAVMRRKAGFQEVSLPAFAVAVSAEIRGDTVGAGDSFMGGLIAALLQALPDGQGLSTLTEAQLLRSLRFATAVAGLTCCRAGADAPDLAMVEALLTAQG